MYMTRTGAGATDEQCAAAFYLGSLEDPLAPWVQATGPIDPSGALTAPMRRHTCGATSGPWTTPGKLIPACAGRSHPVPYVHIWVPRPGRPPLAAERKRCGAAGHGRIAGDAVTGRVDLGAETLELLSGVGSTSTTSTTRSSVKGRQVRSLVEGVARPGPADAGQGPPLGAGTLILPGGAHRARRLSGDADVRAGADDASHQRAHW
jgi:hypothetical protein